MSALAPNGASALSASRDQLRRAGRARRRCRARSTSVALPAAASLPAALPSVAASPSTSSRSSAIWNAWPIACAVAVERASRSAHRRLPRMAPARQAEAQQRAGLHRLQRRRSRSRLRRVALSPKRPSAARSSIWPPTMPPRPAARASPVTSAMRTAASGCVFGARQHVEGEGEQAVAGQDRGRLVEGLVRGRPAAAQVVVVHRRQVVVHQRIAMHAVRAPRRPSARARAATPNSAALSTTRNGRSRLPPPRRRIAHGLEQPLRPRDLAVGRRVPPAAGRAGSRSRRRRRRAARRNRWSELASMRHCWP